MPGLIEMSGNLPRIDSESALPMNVEATRRCPTGAIQWLEQNQFAGQLTEQAASEKRYA